MPITPNQEAQLVGILNTYKVAIGWDILRNNDMKNLMINLSTFEDYLQNLTIILKQYMETNLILIWKKCHTRTQKGIMLGSGVNQTEAHKSLPFPSLTQQKSLPKNYNNISRFGYTMLAQCILLIWAHHQRIIYEYVSAMMTKPPDWPCSFEAIREAPNMISRKIPL